MFTSMTHLPAAQAGADEPSTDSTSATDMAEEILDPPKPPAQLQGIPIAPQQIQIQVNAVAGNQVRRIQIKNGVKRTDITDGDRKIKIVEGPVAIQIEVTEKKNGKAITRKFQAKNADDLKKNHPEGHKLGKTLERLKKIAQQLEQEEAALNEAE
jgi:hypothetical protein